jgi:hypothetical protein
MKQSTRQALLQAYDELQRMADVEQTRLTSQPQKHL